MKASLFLGFLNDRVLSPCLSRVSKLQALSFCVGLALAATWSGVASAHIDLLDPPMRNGNQKSGPCEGRPRGTPKEYEAGATIDVRFNETIPHPGSFFISFDPDGDDFDGDGDGTMDYPAYPGMPDSGNGSGSLVLAEFTTAGTVQVTLPDIECDNCTLQVIQVMTDNRQPTAIQPYAHLYFRCADIVLVRGESSGEGGAGGETSEGGSGGDVGGGGGAGGDMDPPGMMTATPGNFDPPFQPTAIPNPNDPSPIQPTPQPTTAPAPSGVLETPVPTFTPIPTPTPNPFEPPVTTPAPPPAPGGSQPSQVEPPSGQPGGPAVSPSGAPVAPVQSGALPAPGPQPVAQPFPSGAASSSASAVPSGANDGGGDEEGGCLFRVAAHPTQPSPLWLLGLGALLALRRRRQG